VDERRDRAIGALLGLAAGDAIGTPLEFAARDSRPRITGMTGGGPFALAPGQWTDDTSMALCLADSLLACGGLNPGDLVTRFLAWYRRGLNSVTGRCFDIGNTTAAALRTFERTGDPFSGPTDARSAGNGGVMRLAPAAIRFHRDRDAAVATAADQSRTTHGAAAATDAARLFAHWLFTAIDTGDPSAALAPTAGFEPSVEAIGLGSWRGKPRSAISSSGYVIHTLEAAAWCVEQADSFEQAVLLAANLADDADTVAAVTGQLAGALWGASAIPQPWLDVLAWRPRIDSLANALYAAGDLSPGGKS
jgi:ADP-ribosyl-[dinitrogen reductase] hydrolase